MPISSSTAAALEPRDHGSRFVWRAVSFFVAACLIVLGARYLINDAIPFLTDIAVRPPVNEVESAGEIAR